MYCTHRLEDRCTNKDHQSFVCNFDPLSQIPTCTVGNWVEDHYQPSVLARFRGFVSSLKERGMNAIIGLCSAMLARMQHTNATTNRTVSSMMEEWNRLSSSNNVRNSEVGQRHMLHPLTGQPIEPRSYPPLVAEDIVGVQAITPEAHRRLHERALSERFTRPPLISGVANVDFQHGDPAAVRSGYMSLDAVERPMVSGVLTHNGPEENGFINYQFDGATFGRAMNNEEPIVDQEERMVFEQMRRDYSPDHQRALDQGIAKNKKAKDLKELFSDRNIEKVDANPPEKGMISLSPSSLIQYRRKIKVAKLKKGVKGKLYNGLDDNGKLKFVSDLHLGNTVFDTDYEDLPRRG